MPSAFSIGFLMNLNDGDEGREAVRRPLSAPAKFGRVNRRAKIGIPFQLGFNDADGLHIGVKQIIGVSCNHKELGDR